MEEMQNVLMSYLRVTQHMSQQFRAHFGRLNLTFPQALVLNVLGEEGPVPISMLAERTGSANGTVYRCERLFQFASGYNGSGRQGHGGRGVPEAGRSVDRCRRAGQVRGRFAPGGQIPAGERPDVVEQYDMVG